MAAIEASKLTKVYRTYRKERGLWGAVKGLLWRHDDETRAADQVSFQIEEGEFVGLSDLLEVRDKMNVMVRELSLGERMKMELIAALIHEPRVLFLDEPTIGLDVVSQKRVREFLRIYNEQHRIVTLLTSHYMQDIE